MRATLAFLPFLIAALPATAQVYRCSVPGQPVSYQEQPCEGASQGGALALPTQFPDYLEPRNRLAAREAAADARILRRLEIESAERIARDERLAREAQLQAERERAEAADAAWYPVYAVRPLRMRPMARPRMHGPNPYPQPLMR